MKTFTLLLTLALAASANAEEWLSVGAATAASQSVPKVTDSSKRASMVTAAAPRQNNLVGELAVQVEQLQQEVARLQGRLEEQEHIIKRLQDESQTRYLDLDKRLSSLTKGSPSSISTDSAEPVESADSLYQRAMNFVREKKYAEASDAFDRFITSYPKDALTSNALYWSGEVWLVRGELDKALTQFKRVSKDFPNSEKVADATYKVGVTLHRQGKTAEAKVWLKKVIDKYQGKADATVKLAKSYLEKL